MVKLMKYNVLVFPCGSEIGLEIYRSLKYSNHFNIIGGSTVSDHGKYVYEDYLEGIPNVDNPDFINQINKIAKERKVDFIIPAHDSVVLLMAQNEENGNLVAKVLTSPYSTCKIARSKYKTYIKLKNIVEIPKIYDNLDIIYDDDFPLFLKPDVGQGSKGTQKVNTKAEISFYKSKDPTLLALEYLPGPEYTVDCFTDKSGRLRYVSSRVRARTSNGISVNSKFVEDDRFIKFANTINDNLSFRGVWFFQVKERANGQLVLMEIAPRIAGTMALDRCRGVNLVLLSLYDALDIDVSIEPAQYEITIDRALENRYKHNIKYKHVYIDYDDLIIYKSKINTEILRFLIQCINNDVKIHLLTRHSGDIYDKLKQKKIFDIFDTIVQIKDNTPKSKFITEKKSIFIDDSFAEREEVNHNCNIPVFDAHMVEALL